MEKPLLVDSGWKRQSAPELIAWERPGQEIAGVLVGMAHVEVNRKQVLQYTLALDEKRFKLLATYDLTQKLGKQHLGHAVRIKYLGDDQTISRNGNAMKVFDVLIKQEKEAGAIAGGPITDEDIPF